MKYLILMLASTSICLSQIEPADSDNDGYLNISTLEHLRWLSETPEAWDKNFELDNDIDASDTRNWNVGDHDRNPLTKEEQPMGWRPIGNIGNGFRGIFDGKNHVISNLKINTPRNNKVGLIGQLYRGC